MAIRDLREAVEVRRGTYIESVHSFAYCVVNLAGTILYSHGNVDTPYPLRSLTKPFLAAEVIRCGAADALGLSDVEIALAAGSHDGEPRHVEAVRALLGRLGLDETDLACGPALEGNVVIGSPLMNNCSGKHAVALVLCRYFDVPTANYTAPDHPVQLFLQQRLMREFGRDNERTEMVIDGCGMPIFGATLREMATAYCGFAECTETSVTRVRYAMTTYPEYVGGSGHNLDSRLLSIGTGQLISKIGAEGLHADGLCNRGIGLAVKVLDGNSRALGPIVASLIERCAPALAKVDGFTRLFMPPVVNASGTLVGDICLPRFPEQ